MKPWESHADFDSADVNLASAENPGIRRLGPELGTDGRRGTKAERCGAETLHGARSGRITWSRRRFGWFGGTCDEIDVVVERRPRR